MVKRRLAKITCYVYRNLSPLITKTLRELAIPELSIQSGRAAVLRSHKGLFGIRSSTDLDENPVDVFRFYVPLSLERRIIGLLASRADLTLPGRGSIYSQEVTIIRSTPIAFDEKRLKEVAEVKLPAQTGFSGICCIVQRGEGNRLARAILDVGFSVPIVTYGQGMGIRDRLGLLRIAIPVDKEVVTFVVDRQDALQAMNLVIDTARLDHPGRGFIYLYPIRFGIINTRLRRGEEAHVASVEQIVAAIDELTGSASWRRRELPARPRGRRRGVLTELANCTVVCREGRAQGLVRAAMDVGAGGATLAKLRFGGFAPLPEAATSHSREMSDLIVSGAMTEAVVGATEKAGIFDSQVYGFVEVSPVEMASTYIARERN